MAWRRWGAKPLSEPMMVYRRIYASLGLNELKSRLFSGAQKAGCVTQNSYAVMSRDNPFRIAETISAMNEGLGYDK